MKLSCLGMIDGADFECGGVTVTPLAHLSSTDTLGASPILTAEGIVLERGGESRDNVIPLVQSGEPNLDVHDLGGGLWQNIFQ